MPVRFKASFTISARNMLMSSQKPVLEIQRLSGGREEWARLDFATDNDLCLLGFLEVLVPHPSSFMAASPLTYTQSIFLVLF